MRPAQVPIPRFLFTAVAILSLGLFFSACTEEVPHKGTVCIPVPPDTSALGKKNHFIPKSQIEAFRKEFEIVRDSVIRETGLFIPFSEDFNKPALIRTLEDPKCTGIRIYYGIRKADRKEIRLIIVGIDEQGNDLFYIVRQTAQADTKEGGVYGQTEPGGNEWGNCKPPCP